MPEEATPHPWQCVNHPDQRGLCACGEPDKPHRCPACLFPPDREEMDR